ncbi:MAG: hypothetical protein JSR39_00985 [Verrucomicrobia bacterium]|nr:hypothetical protein [Verrucomicrobiota bacterium]
MSAAPVSHAQLPPIHDQGRIQNSVPAREALNTASTLRSYTVRDDCCGSFCNSFTSFFRSSTDRLLQKLSRIPGLGSLYRQEMPEPTTHMARLELLYTVFRTAVRPSTPPIPTNDKLPRLIEHFRQLTDRIDQLEAFSHIQKSANTTDAIVRAFFDALPASAQEGIKNNIVLNYVRNRNEQHLSLDGSVVEVAQHTVDHQIRTFHMNAAIVNYLATLRRTGR